jgi:TPR repeat protein
MPRVIFKCPYLKGGGATAQHRSFYVSYIARREGVQKIDESRRSLPATKKQTWTAGQILRDFPDAREMFEYEDYMENPTRENASEFITAALEQNLHLAATRENYVNYIAMRPRAERAGTHGLFTAAGIPVILEQIANEAAGHPGNLWMPVFSLRREDAVRLGYDSAESWRSLLSAYAPDMAKHMKIQPDSFRWYAAYHDEGHHPHVHMICWSDDPADGFLTRDGIGKIKAGIAGRIFKEELTEVFQQQTLHRDSAAAAARDVLARLTKEMQNGVLRNDHIEQLTLHLAGRLRFHSGKKQYGYLKAPLKALVNEITDELAKDERVREAYGLWCETRLDVLRTYQKNPAHPGPLSAQKEFNHIRNIIIAEAVKISRGEFTFEPEAETGDMPVAHDKAEPVTDQASEELQSEQNEDELIAAHAEKEPHVDQAAEEAAADRAAEEGSDTAGSASENALPHVTWTKEYRQAKKYFCGSDETPRDFITALRLLTEEALTGNALAMHDLGRMYADGLGTEPDPDIAHEWYTKAFTAFTAVENKKAGRYTEYRIGRMYAAGQGTGQDYSEAAGWLRMSADGNYKYAQYSLAGLYCHGKGVDQDYAAAFGLYSSSAMQGFPYADFELGRMYRDGTGAQMDADISDVHFKKAFRGFVSLEKQSHDDKLQYRLGWMLENGIGTPQDIPTAMAFYEKAAETGNTYAQYAWAKLILKDTDALPRHVMKAVSMLKKAADAGNGPAVYALAKLYRDGDVAEKDVSLAAALFERAAVEFENEYAAYQLGRMYITGEDAAKDVDAAVRWFTKAAEQGNQHAQYALGKLYLMGKDVPRDREAALRWLTLSADQGNVCARFFLDHFDQWRDPSAFLAATRLLHHIGRIFESIKPPPSGSAGITLDRKLLRKLQAKKIAQGHAEDDHAQAPVMWL